MIFLPFKLQNEKIVHIIFNDLAVSMLKHVHVSVGTNGSEEGFRSSRAEVTSSCGLPKMEAGNWTKDLCKSGVCSWAEPSI